LLLPPCCCSGVLLRYARVRGRLLLDVSGIGLLAAPAG
jgi:hypothetical protein